MNTLITQTLALALLAGFSSPLFAQTASEPDGGETRDEDGSESSSEMSEIIEDGDRVHFNFHASTTYFDEADFDDDSGSLEAWRVAVGIGASSDLGDGRWSAWFDVEHTDYDFSDPDDVIDLAPRGVALPTFDDVTTLTLSSSYSWQPNDDGNKWFIGGMIGASYESGAEFDDSITGGVFGGFRHRVNDKLELGIGVMVRSRLEDDVLVIPLPQINYDLGNGWSLQSQRAGAKLMYQANDAFAYGVSAEYDSRSFRLDTDNSISEGAATESRVPIAFQIEYKPSKSFILGARVGAAVGSELEFFDSSGNTVVKRDLDTSVFVSFSGTILF